MSSGGSLEGKCIRELARLRKSYSVRLVLRLCLFSPPKNIKHITEYVAFHKNNVSLYLYNNNIPHFFIVFLESSTMKFFDGHYVKKRRSPTIVYL